MLVAPLRYVGRRGFKALLFRRSIAELAKPDGLLSRAWELYPGVGGQPRDGGKIWEWESGARIDLAGMDNEAERFKFAGVGVHFLGFDELTTFAEVQYLYMLSCLKPTYDIPLRVRSTTNPTGEGAEWVLERYAPWLRGEDPTYHGAKADFGESLHYALNRETDKIEICDAAHPDARSRTFIPASYEDTPQLDSSYRATLDMLDPLTRAQLRDGNWLVRPGGGLMFKRDFWSRDHGTIIDDLPCEAECVGRVRYWDLAATLRPKEAKTASTPAATAGVLMSRWSDESVIVEDVIQVWDRPGPIKKLVRDTAERDQRRGHVRVCINLDPGQAGVAQRDDYAATFMGVEARFRREQGDKTERAKPLSAAAENGLVRLLNGAWLSEYVKEMVAFPSGKLKDQVDASSGAFLELRRQDMRAPVRAKTSGAARKGPSMHGRGSW